MLSKKKFAIFFLILILVIPILNKIVHAAKQSVWDGNSHINIAIDNGDVEVWSLEPSEKSVHVIVIPKNVYLSVGSYGTYRASAVGKLSLLEKKDGSLFKSAIEESLSVPIEGVIVRKEGNESILSPTDFLGLWGLLKTLSEHPFSGQVTNLSSFDVLRLWFLTLSFKKEVIDTVNLSETNVVTKIVLPDGGEGLTVDQEQFSKLALQYFADKRIESENLTIEVINGTTVTGLASRAARIITNIGGNVVTTTQSEDKVEKTVVLGKTKSYTASKIAKVFDGKISDDKIKDARADIQVVLGKESD